MSVLLLGLLGVAAQVSVGDAPGALAALGDHLPGEPAPATVLRARLMQQLDRPEAADALLETVEDGDLAVAVDWMRLQLRPDDPAAAWRLLPPADVPADVHLEARLHLATTRADLVELEALAGAALVAPRALMRLYAMTADARWLRRLVVEHGESAEARRVPSLTLAPAEVADRAEALFLARAYGLAEPACEEVLRRGTAEARQRARLRLATIRMRLRERYEEALPLLAEAAKGPDAALAEDAAYRRGLVLGQLERWDEAVAAMRAVGGRYRTRAGYQVGRLLHEAGRYDEAIAAHERFLRRKLPDPDKYRWFLGWAHFRKGDYPGARRVWARLLPSPNLLVGAKALYWTARCHRLEGHEDRARRTVRALSGRAPSSYYGVLGQALVGGGLAARPPHMLRPRRPVLDRAARVLTEAGFPELARTPVETAGDEWRALPLATRRLPWEEGLGARDASDVAAAYRTPYLDLARAAGGLHGVSPWWLLPHMLQESRFRARARSHAGALGPMQVLPRTGLRIAARIAFPDGDFLPSELYAPGVALRHAAWYLAALREEFEGDLTMAIAAYNGGPRRVAEHLRRHQDLPYDVMVEEIGAHETRNYARKVADHIVRYASLYADDAERDALLRALRPPPRVPVPLGRIRF